MRIQQNIYKTQAIFNTSQTLKSAHRPNIGGERAKNASIAATAAAATFACESRKHNIHENLNISLDVCTFAVHLVL